MPEEKVSQQFKKGNGWSYSIMASQHIIVPCRGEADCPMFGEPTDPELHYHEAIPDSPAADAGPRQHEHYFGLNVKTGESVCAVCGCPPVPQEAAPRIRHSDGIGGECPGCEECRPLATAPDWAMRVARKIRREVYGPYLATESAEDRIAAEEKLSALIREAGSERERELTTALTNLVEAIDTGRGTLRRRAEASRLLGRG